ncbi:MAG: hypothetical protein KIT13_11075 [Burkholderiales bacterium]|nr:hypothetical protein [Burkholderiales bacterium]
MQPKSAVLCCALAAAWLPPAAAQQSTRNHPADPAVAVPAPAHASAFAGYRPFGNEKPGAWRELNDGVARAGGHAGILREGAKAASGHDGHKPEPAR